MSKLPVLPRRDLIADFIEMISVGVFIDTACQAILLKKKDFEAIIRVGIEHDAEDITSDYAEFYRSILSASARMKTDLIRSIRAAGLNGDWRASKYILSRHDARYEEKFVVANALPDATTFDIDNADPSQIAAAYRAAIEGKSIALIEEDGLENATEVGAQA